MTVVRSTGRKRRTVVKIEFFGVLADLERTFESVVFFPVFEHLELELWEGLSWINGWKHGKSKKHPNKYWMLSVSRSLGEVRRYHLKRVGERYCAPT